MLHGCRAEFGADTFEPGFPLLAVVVKDAHFDQFVGQQIDIDFVHYRRRETRVADHHHGVQGMRRRAQGTAFSWI